MFALIKIILIHLSSTKQQVEKLGLLCQHPAESVLHAGQARGQATETVTSIIQIWAAEHSAGGEGLEKI